MQVSMRQYTPIGIVRVGIRVGPFVMAAMITRPFDDVILKEHFSLRVSLCKKTT